MKQLKYITIATLIAFPFPSFAEEGKPTEEKKEEKVTFADHVLPIFRAKCGSCHNANDRKGGLVVDNYASLMEGGSSGAVVEVGDAGLSYLWMLVNHESEPKMPPNADKLPAEELAIIQKWIDFGAMENAGSTAMVKKKSNLAKIEVSTERPANVAMPQKYYGEPVHQPSSVNAVTALATSPWAPLVAVSGYRQVAVYNSLTLEMLGVLPFPEGQPQILKFSRNGSLLMIGGGRGGASGKVVVYDVATGERKIEVGDEYDEVLAADISPDHSMIALGGPKKMLRVYSTATGELLYEQKKHTDWLTAIEFSPDGVLLASGDRSAGVVVWEAHAGQIFYDLAGHQGAISDISWRPDSNVVGTASEDGTIKLWEMQNGGQIKNWNAHGGGVTAMDYTRDGQIVSTGRDNVTRLWNGDGAKVRDFPAMADLAMEVAFDAESKRVLAGNWQGIIAIWNSEDGQPVGQIDTNPPTVSSQIAACEVQLNEQKNVAAGKSQVLAKLKKGISDREMAAKTAQEASATAAQKAAQATVQKQESEKAVATATTAYQAAEQATAQSQKVAQQLTLKSQQDNTNVANLMKALQQAQATFQQAQLTHQATVDNVQKLSALSAAASESAKPTEAEQKVLGNDAAAKQAVATRAALATSVADAAGAAAKMQEQSAAKVQESLKGVEQANATLVAAQQQAKAAQEALVVANAELKKLQEAQGAAGKTLNDMKATLNTVVEAEKVAIAAAAQSKANADKLAEAAKPTPEEMSAIQTAEAEFKAA
ncbi:MAG: hypothetical protein KDA80_15640, partial [Planctomycetaceae bacterium]|nr:hypothetical protein [Planctomycetaceae bacterium]